MLHAVHISCWTGWRNLQHTQSVWREQQQLLEPGHYARGPGKGLHIKCSLDLVKPSALSGNSSKRGIWAFIFPSGKMLRDHSYDTSWLCVKIMFLFSFFKLLALLFFSESSVQVNFLNAFIQWALGLLCITIPSKALVHNLFAHSALCLPCRYLPLSLQTTSFWSLDLILLISFSLVWWCVPVSLCSPKELDIMWQLFPLHNDGFGRKRWVNFPNSQQLEGATSTNVTWLSSSMLIFFWKYKATGKSLWLY